MTTMDNQLDDLDPKEYALMVVNPYWMGGLEQRVRYALERTGFEIESLRINDDESQATFLMRQGVRAQFRSVQDARAALRDALTSAGCLCGEDELALALQNDHWNGAYSPASPDDDIDPVAYLNDLPPRV